MPSTAHYAEKAILLEPVRRTMAQQSRQNGPGTQKWQEDGQSIDFATESDLKANGFEIQSGQNGSR